VLIQSASGTPVYGSNPRFHGDEGVVAGVRAGVAHLLVENLPICAGDYRMSVWLGDWQTDYDQKIDALAFHFSDGQPSSAPSPEVIGYVATRGRWHIQPHDPLP
jgi:lipopolysaccharide transport system ATP-binding protein